MLDDGLIAASIIVPSLLVAGVPACASCCAEATMLRETECGPRLFAGTAAAVLTCRRSKCRRFVLQIRAALRAGSLVGVQINPGWNCCGLLLSGPAGSEGSAQSPLQGRCATFLQCTAHTCRRMSSSGAGPTPVCMLTYLQARAARAMLKAGLAARARGMTARRGTQQDPCAAHGGIQRNPLRHDHNLVLSPRLEQKTSRTPFIRLSAPGGRRRCPEATRCGLKGLQMT
jgi:hypothetical protein